jgi:hypothetical protein
MSKAKPAKTTQEFASDIQQFFFKSKDGCSEIEIENFKNALADLTREELDTNIVYPRPGPDSSEEVPEDPESDGG